MLSLRYNEKLFFGKRQRHVIDRPNVTVTHKTAHRIGRLALIVVAALLGLTGVLQSLTNHVPFGLATLAEDQEPLVDKWKNLREQMVADDEAVSACLHDGVPDCAAAETLLHVIEDAKAHQGKALIACINRAINLLIRPAPGAWVGALEVLTFADGDCKAYAIAKFFALREAGLPAERLRLVIVRNRRRSEDHMVVAANVEDAWFILDNATMILATDSENTARYTPLLLLDESGVRRYQ
jgi:predicted transglutaminase-like cysteine proteinase